MEHNPDDYMEWSKNQQSKKVIEKPLDIDLTNLTVPTQQPKSHLPKAAKPNLRQKQAEEEDEIQIEQPLNRR